MKKQENLITIEFLENLQFSWSAVVQLKNGQETTIWYTALPMSKIIIDKVVSVASDYPKYERG